VRARPWLRASLAILMATLALAAVFVVAAEPASAATTISSFSPTSGCRGTSVTIDGHGFTGATAVKFGSEIASYTVNSNVRITATVPGACGTGSTGPVTVSVTGSDDTTATSSDPFTITSSGGPTITSFSPVFGTAGTHVTITGTNLSNATEVSIGSKVDPGFSTNAAGTQITATVQNGAHSGPVQVTTPAGTASSVCDFTVGTAAAPCVTSFSPTSGPVGAHVTITGIGLTGATAVTVGGVADPSFHIVSDTQITATVPPTAITGPIAVTGPGGSFTTAVDFMVTSPYITGFDPIKGPWGTLVVITGANFTNATAVRFNGSTTMFSANSSTQITATVPTGAATGPIAVTTSVGTGSSVDPFTIKHERSLSFSIAGGRTGSGTITVSDGTSACMAGQPIEVQRRVESSWRTVRSSTSGSSGSYSIRLPDKDGKYRAVATKTTLSNSDVCGKARSVRRRI
jgi:large repetitive protein